MRVLIAILLIILSQSVLADTQIKGQIFDIDRGQGDDETLIFLSSGQVVTYPSAKSADFDTLREGLQKKYWFLFTINSKKEITRLEKLDDEVASKELHLKKNKTSISPYQPSILKSFEDAKSLFRDARANPRQESQCFNRAHVWTYDWRINKNLYTSKIWLFFTRQYIRKYKFDWWFHVAPLVHVVQDGSVKERILDMKYAKGPLKLKTWTDIFMRDNAHCRVVNKYTDQADYPESGSCFVMKSSMYYYQPLDLELLEITGEERTRWIKDEVKQAYLDAFEVTL